MIVVSLIIAGAGFSVLVNQDVQQQLGQLDAVKQNMQDLVNPNKMYERLGVDVLSLQVVRKVVKRALKKVFFEMPGE